MEKNATSHQDIDVLIIGAGPAGTIAAGIMQQQGLKALIVEKQLFPRFQIGESLLPRCMEALDEAGFLDQVKDCHFQDKNGAKFVWGDQLCDFSFDNQHTKGWSWTWQVKRADFDKKLADCCSARGIEVLYEAEVIAVNIQEDGSSHTTIKLKDGSLENIQARFILDASGYGRVLPTLFGLNKPSTQHTRRALFAHIQDPHRLEVTEPDRIIIIVHNPDTWIWVIPFSDGTTSVGYVGSPEFFEAYPGTKTEQFLAMLRAEPSMAIRFREPEMVWPEPRVLQGWSTSTDKFYGKGYVLTGNVTEFLDPVFSSGVTLASVSSQRAAHLVARHLKGEQVDWEEDYQHFMETGVEVFRVFVDTWYDGTLFKIFFSPQRDQKLMNQICSVLAGYVWDATNPFVKNSEKTVRNLAKFLESHTIS
ncbi:MAG: tryptophan 7-halogenase [Bacteroidetes bacterium]|nr:tryptophan 7-halogenase [Bacteroidota bacterium]MBS1630441.1 tryptophan 7-halogenase [Bacteroidota bacterium]